MANIYCSHFEYAGVSSKEKCGLILANAETERFLKVSGAISGKTIFSKKEKKIYLIDDDYSDAAEPFDVDIVTDTFRCLTPDEQRTVEKWLFNRRDYYRLYFDMDEDPNGETYEIIDGAIKRLYLNCRFTNPSKLEYNGGIIGYRATVEPDSNMFWQDEITKRINIGGESSEATTTVSIDVDSDIDDYIYPKVTIQIGDVGGDIIISNNTDDVSRLTKFIGLPPKSRITMDGSINRISEHYYDYLYKQNFIRLLDGRNAFVLIGNIDYLEFVFSQRRMM